MEEENEPIPIMESWDAIVTSYPEDPTPIQYARAIRTAKVIIAEDLAPFETEWLAKTLLFKPVYLFEVIKSKTKRKDEEWVKHIGDSFKILSKLIETSWDVVENYSQEIIELTSLSFDAQTRREAISCLLKIVRRPSVVLTNEFVANVIKALEDAKTSKAPLAELVGAICRYFPELVEDHFNSILRIYLKMLGLSTHTNWCSTTISNNVLVAVLKAINDLLEGFGERLPEKELKSMYHTMSEKGMAMNKCLDVILTILQQHAGLFKDTMYMDKNFRNYLWQVQNKNAMDALTSMYQAIFTLDDAKKQATLTSEIKPRLSSGPDLVKQTALRILMLANAGQPGDGLVISSGVDLEYQLRTKRVDYDEAATISWCIESNLSNSGNMLLTCIMFYDNLPSNMKRDIVVNGIMKVTDDLRKAALILLLKLSLQEGLDKYIYIWRSILDNTAGPDLDKAVKIFQETVHHILQDLATTLADEQKSYTDVKPILSVLAVLLSLQKTEYNTPEWCLSIIPSIIHLARHYGQEPVQMIQETPDDEMPYVETFQEDTVYKKLLTTMTGDRQVLYDGTLSSFQAIFSKGDSDYKVLNKILANLETVIEENSNNLDKRQLSLVINQIERLKPKIVLDNKDARAFQKDVIIFLGKFGQMCLQGSFSEDIYTLQLKNKVYFNVQNIVQGTVLKIDLQRILQLCLLRGETDALYCLLVILTAYLRDRPDPGLQEATIRVIHEIFRNTSGKSETEICMHPALYMCNTTACVQAIIKGITEELDPKVRRKLSEHLQLLLTHNPGTDTTAELLNVAAEHCSFMITRNEASIYLPDLDILRAFLLSILDNNALIIAYLPKILVCTSIIDDASDIFEKASDIFLEKVDLFTENEILQLIQNIIEKFSSNNTNTELIINNITKFLKRIFDIKKFESKILIGIILSMLQALTVISPQFSQLVTLLAYFNLTFEFDTGLRKEIVGFENCKILEQLSMMEVFDENGINASFLFLREYADELLEVSTEKTYKCLGLVIENMTPQTIITYKNNITTSLSTYKTKPETLEPIKGNIKKWFQKLNLQELTSLIENRKILEDFTKDVSEKILALKIMSAHFDFEFDAKKLTVISMDNFDDKLSRIFLIDLLAVCEKNMSDDDFRFIVENKFDCLKQYIGVYFKRIISHPCIFRGRKSSILIDLMNYFVTAFDKDSYKNVLDIISIDLWPAFEANSNFEGKLSVVRNVLSFPEPVSLDFPPVKWAATLLTDETTILEDRIKILSTLPAGEQFRSLYRAFASCLPVRLSEIQGRHIPSFRALLDSLAVNGDMTLLDIIIVLAGGDDTIGWWDYAFSACMKSLAAKEDIITQILTKVNQDVMSKSSMTVCNRILLPLLRHTSRKLFEDYLCTVVAELLDGLRHVVAGPSNTQAYKKRLTKHAITFNILKIVFDKLSTDHLETGVINEKAGNTKPWYLLETTCKYCATIRDHYKCPNDASEDLKQIYLWVQTSSYNCLCAAMQRKISKGLSTIIFNVHAWASIVDKDAVYPFYLKSYVRSREGSKPAKRSMSTMATTSSFTGTVRSAIFLTTLSENPLHYDLIPNDEEQEEEEELLQEFEDSELNAYGCLSTVTYLLEHVSTLEQTGWRDAVITAVSTDLPTNAKWLLAQAICNASEHLKPHASALCPALFKMIADTSMAGADDNSKPVLNNLHVNLLTTIIKWDQKDLPHTSSIDICIEYLINTCMENKNKNNIQRRLLDTLQGILQLFGKTVQVKWDIFQDYLNDPPKSLIPVLPILERLLKNGVALPNLLSAIFKNVNPSHWSNNATKLSEVTGLALSNTDSVSRSEYLAKFGKILASVRGSNVGSFVKMLFYAQKTFPSCCDFNNVRSITNFATKIEKSKCLSIIASFLENSNKCQYINDIIEILSLKELLDSDSRLEAMKIVRNGLKFMEIDVKTVLLKDVEQNCRSSSNSVRKEAFKVFLKAFQDLVKPERFMNPAKRPALDTSPILNIINSESSLDRSVVKMVSDGMFDRDVMVSKEICDGVEECLSQDLGMRFAELFYIIVDQRSLTENNWQLCHYGSKLIELLFSGLRREDAFKLLKLRDEGLPPSLLKPTESITLQTRTLRTFLRSGVTYRQRVNKAPEKREIDLQMPITDILEVFIKISKTNSQVCQELCVQIMKCLVQTASHRFDLESVIAKYLYDIIKREPFCLTPLVLDACRIFIKDISRIDGFSDSVMALKQAVCNSEGYLYTNILLEDLLIRSGDKSLFVFNFENEDYDVAMAEQGFTMEGLIQAFGSLSNWDDLRLQDRRRIEDSLPRLWTNNEEFTVSLKDYFENNKSNLDYGQWFNKMLASYYSDEITQNKLSWLKHIEKWPKNDFVTSAIIEAIQWQQNDAKMYGSISHNDCLVEWSARLMIRSSYYNHLESNSECEGTLSRQELLWCKEANERGLPSLALQCIDRNKGNIIEEDELLPWLLEKVKAHRAIGLKQNDLGMLTKALEAAETYGQQVATNSSLETNINMQKVVLDLHHDLNSLSKFTLDDIIEEVSSRIQDGNTSQVVMSCDSAPALKSMYDTALMYYDDLWSENDEISQNELLLSMLNITDKVLDLNLTRDCNLLLAIPLNRLAHSDVTVSDATAKVLLEQIHRVFSRLDFCSIAMLEKIKSVLPTSVVNENFSSRLQNIELDICKEYFQLICDANYALLQYCGDLRKNVLNDEDFNKIFKKMKNLIFENKYGGTDYQSLSTLKNRLYALENTDDIDTKAQELKLIINELVPKTQRSTLRLSQLCPELCSPVTLKLKRMHLQRLLRLSPNLHVVKFVEQVTVFTDSIRRPCVIKALLSNGQTRQYICKGGEPMSSDAAVQRAATAIPLLTPKLNVRTYNVTPLGEDAAIIEFLEDHIRLRKLMDVDIQTEIKMNDEKLILAPSLAMELFNEMSAKSTPYLLRSAIESSSSCVQEFIAKKRTFEDTLSSMTILCWLFGVGDRHLHNIMYSTRDGGVCAVDWASIFEYGRRELPPARLTANLLAVCDIKVLESRLQQMLLSLKNNKKIFEVFLKTSFYWLGPEFKELKYINNILQGDTVSYLITRECLDETEIRNKDKYIALLDDVFKSFVSKDTYSVEEQVSYLLQHCTQPSILSVTRRGWEAEL